MKLKEIIKYPWAIFTVIIFITGVFIYWNDNKKNEPYSLDYEYTNMEKDFIEDKDFIEQATSLMDNKQFEDLTVLAKKQIEEKPNDIDAWILGSMAYYQLGDCVNASAMAYHVNMRINPGDTSDKAKQFKDWFSFVASSEICSKE